VYEESRMKPIKYCLKGREKEGLREYNREGELVQSILYMSGNFTVKLFCTINVSK
jgi:hypothetical protein